MIGVSFRLPLLASAQSRCTGITHTNPLPRQLNLVVLGREMPLATLVNSSGRTVPLSQFCRTTPLKPLHSPSCQKFIPRTDFRELNVHTAPVPEMSLLLLQELVRNGDKVREDIWCRAGSDFDIDSVLEILSGLHTQLKVQSALQSIATLLRQHPRNKSLPNQQATRVKHFIKFVFEKTNRGNDRQKQLRKLDCSALKVCGLSYTVKEVLELPSAQFDFLIDNVADFIHRQQLTQHLYREDINKALNSDFDPEDDVIFKEFLKCLSTSADSK